MVTVAFYAFADMRQELVRAGDDAAEARWFALTGLPSLAFDHREILEAAFRQVRADRVAEWDVLQERAAVWPEGAVEEWLNTTEKA